jgi:sugar lactone lactonase YvrE
MKYLHPAAGMTALGIACAVACGGTDDDGARGASGAAGSAGNAGSGGANVVTGGATGTAGASANTAGTGGTTGGSAGSAGGTAGGGAGGASAAGASTAGGADGEAGMAGEGAGGAGGEGGSGGEPPIDFDCSQLPALPAAFDTVNGVSSSEDFVFDAEGRLLNFSGESNALMAFTLGDMKSKFVRPGPEDFVAGVGMLPNGDIVANLSSTVGRFTANGGSEELANSLEYPNGLTVGRNGMVYVAEQSAGRVVRIDPATKKKTTIAEDLGNANGLSLSQDQKTLYVGTFGDGKVWAIDLTQTPAEVRVLAEDFADGGEAAGLDGVATDVCGNVYVTEFSVAKIWRITPDGKSKLAVDLGTLAQASWIPNLHFGSGVGGWDRKTLYVMSLDAPRVFALKVGVPGTTQPQLKGM